MWILNRIKSELDKSSSSMVILLVNDKTSIKNTEKKISNDNGDKEEKSENSKKKWSVHKDILKDMKRSANKFIVFEMYDVNKQNELNELRNIEIVDDFLNKNVCLTKDDMKGWSIDMIAYYKQKSELLVDKGRKDVEEVECNEEDEDVLEEINGIAMSIEVNDVKGMDEGVLEECCSIMVGWNKDEVSMSVLHITRQSVLLNMETRNDNIKIFGTFIYAYNGGLDRKELWKDLEIYKRIIRNEPWFLSGDLNVILTLNEHSAGGSNMSNNIKDFQNCVNQIEVEDINSSVLVMPKCGGIEEGCRMCKTVKSLKGLKKHMKQLAWKNGDVFENVRILTDSMKDIQQNIDKECNTPKLGRSRIRVRECYFIDQ
ncbi:RNA-directed DNA polymerase, eukaryota, reverse transcriptase zinc-binding domain protein [Tanacetum coccineum]